MTRNNPQKIVRFIATKTEKKPTTVSFRTKDGKFVSFNATQAVNVKKTVSFRKKK